MMPVDPTRFRSRHGDLYVSFAGPAMNLGLAIVAVVLGGAWVAFGEGISPHQSFYEHVFRFFMVGAALNLVLMLLNLLPIPPLDGSRMLASLSTTFRTWMADERAGMVGMAAFVLVFIFGSEYLWGIGFGAARAGIDVVAALLGAGAPPA